MSKVTFAGGRYVTGTSAVTGQFKSITALAGSTVIASATFVDGSTVTNMPLPTGVTLDVKVVSVQLSGGSVFLAK
jgi:hypothetical protein